MSTKLLVITLVLVTFGLVVLSSASIIDAEKKFGSPYYYLTHQLLYGVLPGLVLFFILSKVNYKIWRKLALLILFAALIFMILVFIPSFGYGVKGATRWVNLFQISFQPSEILKLALVMYLAAWFSSDSKRITQTAYGTVPFFLIMGFVGLLLILQPDIGTFVVVMSLAMSVYIFAGAKLKHIVTILAIAAVALIGLIIIEPYRLNRIKAFIDPNVDPRGISYQINQSMIAIGSGGIFGVGYGHSTQKFGFLPEVVGDSIFAIIGEELGFVGGLFTLALFGTLGFVLISLAKAAPDQFGRLFVLGVTVWILGQAFLNISAISGVAPLTGVPLPFISYGSSSTVMLLSALGIVMNVSKQSR